ncbi:MAG: hypothetical protein AUF79_09085 [Crenarchaeota archaeon 13_1_20CM_2_51_8]|nr:MAG: hypothetical protein AUF79_09085 [Crenarchaeota archaeon 13_1_20CM_2_51_8]
MGEELVRRNVPLGLREDAFYIGSVAGGLASAGLAWFLSSPLFGVVTGILLGTGLTMLTQSRTQKRLWKRELGLRNIESIYGPLYREIKRNLSKGSPTASTSFQSLEDAEWQRIKSEYLYDFIKDDIRRRLEHHYSLVSKYHTVLGTVLTRVPAAILEEASRAYGENVVGIQYASNVAVTNAELEIDIREAVMFHEHPKSILQKMYGRNMNLKEFSVIVTVGKQARHVPEPHRGPDELAKFDEFYETLCKQVAELESIKGIRQTLKEIIATGRELQAAILKLIKEPWSI